LVVAVAKARDLDVAFLTPHDFHQLSAGYTEDKTDLLDAYIIADLSMRMTHILHEVGDIDETLASLRFLSSRRQAVICDITRLKNGIHDALSQINPPLERFFDSDMLNSDFGLKLVKHYGGPTGFRRAGQNRVKDFIANIPYYKNKAEALTARIFAALDSQSVKVGGTPAAESVLKGQASQMLFLRAELKALDKEIARYANATPEGPLLQTIPGIGPVLAPIIITETGDIERFKGAGQFASYAGIAPAKRQSGTTMNATKKKRRCNRKLKNALVRSDEIAAQSDEASATYYAKKRSEGKCHRQAVIALARCRADIIYAMLKSGQPYQPQATKAN
jgi:transposase